VTAALTLKPWDIAAALRVDMGVVLAALRWRRISAAICAGSVGRGKSASRRQS
jgi:hypothetical protein